MPATIRFDTLRFARRLTDAGLDPRVAEAIVEGISEADTSEIATRDDIAAVKSKIAEVRTEIAGVRAEVGELRTATKADIAELRTATKADIAELRAATKADIAELRAATKTDTAELRTANKTDIAEVKGEIAALKVEMFRFLYLQAAGIVGLTVALIKLLP